MWWMHRCHVMDEMHNIRKTKATCFTLYSNNQSNRIHCRVDEQDLLLLIEHFVDLFLLRFFACCNNPFSSCSHRIKCPCIIKCPPLTQTHRRIFQGSRRFPLRIPSVHLHMFRTKVARNAEMQYVNRFRCAFNTNSRYMNYHFRRWVIHFPIHFSAGTWTETDFGIVGVVWRNQWSQHMHRAATLANRRQSCVQAYKYRWATCASIMWFD